MDYWSQVFIKYLRIYISQNKENIPKAVGILSSCSDMKLGCWMETEQVTSQRLLSIPIRILCYEIKIRCNQKLKLVQISEPS